MVLRFKFIAGLLFILLILTPGIVLAQAQGANAADGATTLWAAIQKYAAVDAVWKFALALVDIIVVVGLVVAAFANIFNFLPIKLDNYQVKQVLPGLIIGVILANLSFFILRLLIESASILSQMIGVILAPMIDGDIGSWYAGPYIAYSLTGELLNSLLVNVPSGLQGVFTAGGGVVALWTLFSGIGGVLTAVLLLVIILIPFIVLALLYLLLIVRVFVIIALFMISPIAFFSLGFPPLKGFWQKWWNTLWRWLMMGPMVYAVLGLATLFLHATNSEGGYRSIFYYLMVNGIAVGLMYLALRIPFMWGDLKIFGLGNAMEKWSKYGARSGKFVTDAGLKGVAAGSAHMRNRGEAERQGIIAGRTAISRARSLGVTDPSMLMGLSMAANRNAVNESQRKARNKAMGNVVKYNPIRMAEGLETGLKQRFETMEKAEKKAIRATPTWQLAAGPEAVIRQTMEDSREMINGMDDPEDIANEITKAVRKTRNGVAPPSPQSWKDLFLGKGPGKLATDDDLDRLGIPPAERAMAQMAMSRLNSVLQRGNRAGVWDSAGALTRSFNADGSFNMPNYEHAAATRRSRRRGGGGPYGDLDGEDDSSIPEADPYADAFVDDEPKPDTRQYAQENGRQFMGGVQHRHHQSRVALEQAAQAAQIPSDHLGPIIELIHEAADQGNALTPADLAALGVDTAHHAALIPAITQYQHTYGKLNQAVQMSVPEDLQRAEQFAIHILPNLQLDRPGFENRIREVRGQLDDYLRELGDNAISQDRLNHIRTEMGKINPALIPADADRSGLREALLKNATNTKKALSILSDETMKQALEGGVQGQDINAVLRQSVNVRAVKDKVTYDTANIVEQLKKQQVPLEEIQTNQEVIQKVSAGVQTLVEIHPEFKQTVGTLEPAAQQTVIEQSVSGLVGEMLKHAPQGTSAHDAVRTFEQREQFAQEIYGQLKRHYEAAHTQQTAAATPPAPQSPQAEVASTEPAAATAPSAPVAPPPVESTPGQIEDIVAPAPADIPAAPSEPESPPEA